MSYKVLFSKLAEKEVKNIIINLKEFTQDLNLIQQRQDGVIGQKVCVTNPNKLENL